MTSRGMQLQQCAMAELVGDRAAASGSVAVAVWD